MSKNPTLVLVLGFIAGCGAAAVAPLVIPPAHAQTTQRWEVYCASMSAGRHPGLAEEMTATGVAAGRRGWEPYSAAPFGTASIAVMCFKRPAP